MRICADFHTYIEDILQMAYKNLQRELSLLNIMPIQSFSAFRAYILSQFSSFHGYVCLEENILTGYMLYSVWETDSALRCKIPEWGYGADNENREEIIGFLFQILAETLVREKTVDFSIKLYAHDTQIQRLFSYMEFGTRAETGICSLSTLSGVETVKIDILSKTEITEYWVEIWALLKQLIGHLQKSPVFYPGQEFTEAAYREFFNAAQTSVYAAWDGDTIIGLIETNPENIAPLFTENEAANLGEIYVLPQYRRSKTGQSLLRHAQQDLLNRGFSYGWVEHGTANPNARYFWNRYFTTYTYEMIRKISR